MHISVLRRSFFILPRRMFNLTFVGRFSWQSEPGPARLIKYSGNNGNPGASGSRRDESDQNGTGREAERVFPENFTVITVYDV